MSLRYSPPKRTVGPRAKENERMRRKVWPAVLKRANYHCENCQAEGVQLVGHHVAGRPGSGLCLGPWANCEELLVALCVGCHRLIHMDKLLTDKLRGEAAWRLYDRALSEAYVIGWRAFDPGVDPADEIRRFVRLLEDQGIEP